MRPWVHRAFRAHQNMLETFISFAAVVLIAHVAGLNTTVTAMAVAVFFLTRVIHAAGMISGIAIIPIRPMKFSVSYLCTLAVAIRC